jgi:hypothetical protein
LIGFPIVDAGGVVAGIVVAEHEDHARVAADDGTLASVPFDAIHYVAAGYVRLWRHVRDLEWDACGTPGASWQA